MRTISAGTGPRRRRPRPDFPRLGSVAGVAKPGKRDGLKIHWASARAGSTPAPGTEDPGRLATSLKRGAPGRTGGRLLSALSISYTAGLPLVREGPGVDAIPAFPGVVERGKGEWPIPHGPGSGGRPSILGRSVVKDGRSRSGDHKRVEKGGSAARRCPLCAVGTVRRREPV